MLEYLAHPWSLWLLGLLGSFSTTMPRHKMPPWRWVAEHPAATFRCVLGSLIALALLQAGGVLGGGGMIAALAAFGTGALGPDALELVMRRGRKAVKRVLQGGGNA